LAAVVANQPYDADPTAGMTAPEKNTYESFRNALETGKIDDGAGDTPIPNFIPDGIESPPWWDAFTQIPYIVYICIVAVPWTALGAALIVWDLVLNIFFNKGWAGANLFLIANSIYGVYQYVISIFVVWEIDPVIKYLHWIRMFSVLLGIMYTGVWLVGLIQFLIIVLGWDGG